MAFSIGDILSLFRTVDRLLDLEKKHGGLIKELNQDLQILRDRVAKLEAREDALIIEAKAAAGVAASAAASQHIAALALRLGALDERLKRLSRD